MHLLFVALHLSISSSVCIFVSIVSMKMYYNPSPSIVTACFILKLFCVWGQVEPLSAGCIHTYTHRDVFTVIIHATVVYSMKSSILLTRDIGIWVTAFWWNYSLSVGLSFFRSETLEWNILPCHSGDYQMFIGPKYKVKITSKSTLQVFSDQYNICPTQLCFIISKHVKHCEYFKVQFNYFNFYW